MDMENEKRVDVEGIMRAVDRRASLLDGEHHSALRMFNGFYEGCPDLVIDLYGRSLLIFNYAEDPGGNSALVARVQAALRQGLPWLEAVLLKVRNSPDEAERRGKFLFGGAADPWVSESGVQFALDLMLHQDASLYLDTA